MNHEFSIDGLFDFLNAGVSAFHSTAAAAAILEENGYQNCPESAAWQLAPGGKYYTTRNGSAIMAWRMPKGPLTGWHAAASHSDSPTWRVKKLDCAKDEVFAKAETEGYGGMIMPSWLDRPLSVAGRVLVETESGIESRLVHPDRAVACIPNLCIHFNRDLNNGMKYNPQVDLQPIFGAAGGSLRAVLAREARCQARRDRGRRHRPLHPGEGRASGPERRVFHVWPHRRPGVRLHHPVGLFAGPRRGRGPRRCLGHV